MSLSNPLAPKVYLSRWIALIPGSRNPKSIAFRLKRVLSMVRFYIPTQASSSGQLSHLHVARTEELSPRTLPPPTLPQHTFERTLILHHVPTPSPIQVPPTVEPRNLSASPKLQQSSQSIHQSSSNPDIAPLTVHHKKQPEDPGVWSRSQHPYVRCDDR